MDTKNYCNRCNLETKYFSNCPRLNMGWYLCPNCNKEEYQRHFPTKEQMCERDIKNIFKQVISEINYCKDKDSVLKGLITKLINYKPNEDGVRKNQVFHSGYL